MSLVKREIAVVGGGLAGYAAALALAEAGFATALLAPPPEREDRRSTALIGPSVAFLARLGVFDRLGGAAEPLATMRLVDDTRRLLRAPTIQFTAGEIGLPAFGYNVLNARLMAALRERAADLAPMLDVIDSPATEIEWAGDEVVLTLRDGRRVAAALVVGADGRRSLVRERAGIGLSEWSYPQTAVVLDFSHELAHGGVSTEFHTPYGPFTQVPMPGRASSLVWVERPEIAALLVDLTPERLAELVEEKMHSILGKVAIEGPVQSFPLKGASARAMTGTRVALVGEAAHVFPPIGAQGLNLGLRDAEALADAVGEARDDPGRSTALSRYAARRRADVLSRTAGVDVLNRSLLAGYLPMQAARALGLAALSAVPPLRRFAMREGVAPGAGFRGLPRGLGDLFRLLR